MTDILINFLFCVFEVYMLYDFMDGCLEKRIENGFITAAVMGAMAAGIAAINSFQSLDFNLLGAGIVFFLETVVLFYGSTKTKVAYWLLFYCIMLSMEFMMAFLFAGVMSSQLVDKELYPSRDFFITLIVKLMSYVVLRLVKAYFIRKKLGREGKLIRLAFLLPFTTMLLYYGLLFTRVYPDEKKLFLSMACILLLFSNILVFYITGKLISVMEQNQEYEMMNLQNKLNHTHYKKLEEVEEKHKRYAHDLKEYLQTISVLATKSEADEILVILKDMEVEIDSISNKIYTSHSILNALICEKELLARKAGIDFSVMIEPGLDLTGINNGDLIVMVGNLTDNAIEAASLCDEKKTVDIKFFSSEGNFIVLDIENTYRIPVKRKDGGFLSTKEDKKAHGIGINSVRETAEKYGGILFLEEKEDIFTSILTLSKTN